MPVVKKEARAKAVGDAVKLFFSGGGSGPRAMDIIPNADGTTTIKTSDVADPENQMDFVDAWDNWEAQEQLRMMDEAAAAAVPHCFHCGRQPCIMFSDEYCTMVTIGEEMAEDGKSNKEIRFALYSHMSKVYHGPGLGKGNRMELPLCIVGEIRDHYPKENGTEYVGFQASSGGGNDSD